MRISSEISWCFLFPLVLYSTEANCIWQFPDYAITGDPVFHPVFLMSSTFWATTRCHRSMAGHVGKVLLCDLESQTDCLAFWAVIWHCSTPFAGISAYLPRSFCYIYIYIHIWVIYHYPVMYFLVFLGNPMGRGKREPCAFLPLVTIYRCAPVQAEASAELQAFSLMLGRAAQMAPFSMPRVAFGMRSLVQGVPGLTLVRTWHGWRSSYSTLAWMMDDYIRIIYWKKAVI